MLVHPALHGAGVLDGFDTLPVALSPDRLAELVTAVAAEPHLWRPVVRHDPEQRWYERLLRTDAVELWLIGWSPGQATPLHDHSGAAGAVIVVEGDLTETTYVSPALGRPDHGVLRPGSVLRLAPSHVHSVGNASARVATSIHAYSPPDLPLRELGSIPGWPERVPAAAALAGASR